MVAGAVIANLRELMIEQGIWRGLRTRAAELAEQPLLVLDTAHGREWVPIASYVALLNALEQAYPSDRIHELGEEWFERALERGFLANMVRSWLRSFARTPHNVTLLVPHLWKVVHQNAGRMRTHVRGEGFVTMRVVPAPQPMLECSGWHRLLEGVGDALFLLAQVDSTVQIGPAMTRADALDFLVLGADASP